MNSIVKSKVWIHISQMITTDLSPFRMHPKPQKDHSGLVWEAQIPKPSPVDDLSRIDRDFSSESWSIHNHKDGPGF